MGGGGEAALLGAAGARPSWSGLFSLLPAACGAAEVLSGQEWQAQQRGAVSSQPLPSPRPTGGNPASAAGSQAGSHQACRKVGGGWEGEEAPEGSRLEAGLPGATPTSGKPPGPGSPTQGNCLSSVIPSFSKPPWAPLKLSPILARSLPAPSPSTFVGEKKLKAAVSGWDGLGTPCRCPAVPRASGGSKGDRSLRKQGEGFAGRGNLVCKDRGWEEGTHGGRAGRRKSASSSVRVPAVRVMGSVGECGLQASNTPGKWAEGPGWDPAEELRFYPGHSRAGSSRPERGGKVFGDLPPYKIKATRG